MVVFLWIVENQGRTSPGIYSRENNSSRQVIATLFLDISLLKFWKAINDWTITFSYCNNYTKDLIWSPSKGVRCCKTWYTFKSLIIFQSGLCVTTLYRLIVIPTWWYVNKIWWRCLIIILNDIRSLIIVVGQKHIRTLTTYIYI